MMTCPVWQPLHALNVFCFCFSVLEDVQVLCSFLAGRTRRSIFSLQMMESICSLQMRSWQAKPVLSLTPKLFSLWALDSKQLPCAAVVSKRILGEVEWVKPTPFSVLGENRFESTIAHYLLWQARDQTCGIVKEEQA